jgi:hypothetical protein
MWISLIFRGLGGVFLTGGNAARYDVNEKSGVPLLAAPDFYVKLLLTN